MLLKDLVAFDKLNGGFLFELNVACGGNPLFFTMVSKSVFDLMLSATLCTTSWQVWASGDLRILVATSMSNPLTNMCMHSGVPL